jgi:hypothetical protein
MFFAADTKPPLKYGCSISDPQIAFLIGERKRGKYEEKFTFGIGNLFCLRAIA